MRIKSLKGVIATANAGLLAGLMGCSTTPLPPDRGCGVPGGLCAPAEPNTSAVRPAPTPPPEAPDSETRTSPVELYPGTGTPQSQAQPGSGTARIALLLPLQSPGLGQAAPGFREKLVQVRFWLARALNDRRRTSSPRCCVDHETA